MNRGFAYDIHIPSRIGGTCLWLKRGCGQWLMWDSLVIYNSVSTSQSLRSGSPVKRVWLPTSHIRKLKSSHRWGDGPSIFLGVRVIAEVQFLVGLRMALNAFTTGSMEDLSIT